MSWPILPLEEALAEPGLPEGREELIRLEQEVALMPQANCPLRHFFAKGLYIRELTVPKGVVLTGAIHLVECVSVVAKGVILISDGAFTVRLEAPFTMIVPAGTKKAGFALEETVWIDSYPNPDDERDIEVLEQRYMTNSQKDYLTRTNQLLEQPCLD